MSLSQGLKRSVAERAKGRCEYCLMHQALQGATFYIEHVFPHAKGGSSDEQNLAWACPRCNLCKSDRVEIIDGSGVATRLFNPRVDRWAEHFRFNRYEIEPLTAIGKVTTQALDLNHIRRVRIRKAEELFGLFPPQEAKT